MNEDIFARFTKEVRKEFSQGQVRVGRHFHKGQVKDCVDIFTQIFTFSQSTKIRLTFSQGQVRVGRHFHKDRSTFTVHKGQWHFDKGQVRLGRHFDKDWVDIFTKIIDILTNIFTSDIFTKVREGQGRHFDKGMTFSQRLG